MNTQIVHTIGKSLEILVNETSLFHYVYQPDTPVTESPKPYFHPLKTLAGHTLTLFRPIDHPWHHALCMTLTRVDEENFWGGPTYRDGSGYQMENNHGCQQHVAWNVIEAESSGPRLEEEIDWIASDGEKMFREVRHIAVPKVDPENGYYVLDLSFHLTNVTDRSLRIGTYHSVEGKVGSHYTGLLFRGQRGFSSMPAKGMAAIMAADGLEGDAQIHGAASPWLGLWGTLDTSLSNCTILLIDQPENPGYPINWFIRGDVPVLSCSFISQQNMDLAAGANLDLRYRLVIADGAWSRVDIEKFYQEHSTVSIS